MRVVVDVTTSATELPWHLVTAPGRAIAYRLLERRAPKLAMTLHEVGYGPHRMVPFGYGAPLFPHAKHVQGAYAVGGPGTVEFGSPLDNLAEALAAAISRRPSLDWGGVELLVAGVRLVEPPDYETGQARMRTRTPVVLRARETSGPARSPDWLLPDEPQFPARFVTNLELKAETLGLATDVQLDSVIAAGPKQLLTLGNNESSGATIDVALSGDPKVLSAVWSWGLGESNAAGFGWVDA